MLYAVWARDRAGMLAERQRAEAHRKRLREPAPHEVRVVLAGPLLDEASGEPVMCGTLLVIDARDEAAVRAFIGDDPYVAAGVYGDVDIRRWQPGIGPAELLVK